MKGFRSLKLALIFPHVFFKIFNKDVNVAYQISEYVYNHHQFSFKFKPFLTQFTEQFKHPRCTMWKFHNFSVTQILREFNFGESRIAKSAVFAIFRALNFVHLVNFRLQKVKNS